MTSRQSSLPHDGFLVVKQLLEKPDRDAIAASFEHHERAGIARSSQVLFVHRPPPPDTPSFDAIMLQWLNPHRRPDPLSTLPIARKLRPIVEEWLGERAILFQDLLLDKGESQRNRFAWHQDYPFWPVDIPRGLVVWAPIDPVDASSGSLILAAKSHHGGLGPAIDLHSGQPQPGTTERMTDVETYEHVCPQLEPGDAIAFHPLLWHASAPNRSGKHRRAWASSWLAASVRVAHARAPRHPLCKTLADGAPITEWEMSFP